MASIKYKTENGYVSIPMTVPTKTNEENGNGIGTCSTSSGTALEVSLTNYELVQNGFVAVTFSNDVPANATLNINSKGAKPIYYKGSAIEADVIKADDTAIFSYDGTNYVLCSSGAGGAAPDTDETLSITLNAIGTGSSVSDLNGATVTVTNEDTTETILSTTWSGLVITVKIPMSTNYSVTVGNVSEYITPSSQTYYSSYMGLNDVVFNYASSIGFYISDLDKNLYTAETWQKALDDGKVTVNSALGVAVFTSSQRFIINSNTQQCQFGPESARYNDVTNPPKFTSYESAATDFNGKTNTNTWTSVYSGNYAANIAKSLKFPDNKTSGYIPAGGQMMIVIQNRSTIFNLFNLFTSQLNINQYYWTSTNWGYVTDSGSVRIYASYTSGFTGLYYFRIFDTVNLMVIRDWND